MRILVTGSGRLGVSLLKPLLQSQHEVIGVILDGRKASAFRRWLNPRVGRWIGGRSSLGGLAVKNGLPIYWLDQMNEQDLTPIRAAAPDLILVGGFGIIFKPPLLEIPRVGCVNMHSSLLPRHRGPNPFFAVLMQGEAESGVTFHVMTPQIDDGRILDQSAFPITASDSIFTIYQKSCDRAGERVAAVMDRIETEGLAGAPQDPEAATYDKRPTVDDAWLDWEKPAEQLERLVRAITPSPFPRFLFRGNLVYVASVTYSAAPVSEPPGTVIAVRPKVRVATGEGVLTIRFAFTSHPFMWLWPSRWNRPEIGEKLN
ncbi:MAG: methionyl-tRNA formyltransferase [Candidatus Hydrogenedentes bacterium]|nr:methionyl-tRNA formyltransferase [Candidatus Hydrogenedentota bacterium]